MAKALQTQQSRAIALLYSDPGHSHSPGPHLSSASEVGMLRFTESCLSTLCSGLWFCSRPVCSGGLKGCSEQVLVDLMYKDRSA